VVPSNENKASLLATCSKVPSHKAQPSGA